MSDAACLICELGRREPLISTSAAATATAARQPGAHGRRPLMHADSQELPAIKHSSHRPAATMARQAVAAAWKLLLLAAAVAAAARPLDAPAPAGELLAGVPAAGGPAQELSGAAPLVEPPSLLVEAFQGPADAPASGAAPGCPCRDTPPPSGGDCVAQRDAGNW